MKVTRSQTEENRSALVAAASLLLQEKGFDGAGLADICSEAGLTQGAVYRQFGSKSGLAAEACRVSHANGYEQWSRLTGTTPSDVEAYLTQYFLSAHIEDAGAGCPMAAYACEVNRQDETVQETFKEGFLKMAELMASAIQSPNAHESVFERSLFIIAAMVGCVSMARSTQNVDPKLSRRIIAAAQRELAGMAHRVA